MFVPRLEKPRGPLPVMVRRVMIAQAALDKFQGKPFRWGRTDCAKLAEFVLKKAGYEPGLASVGTYSTEKAALAALKARKMRSMTEAVDSVEGLKRIAPLGVLPGDLIAFPADVGGWDALVVALGNGRVLGFTERAERGACSIIAARFDLASAAWSVVR
jgi:hypothetical protein